MILFNKIRVYNFKILSLLYKEKKKIDVKLKTIQDIFNYSDLVDIMCFDDIKMMESYIEDDLPDWVKGIAYDNKILLLYNEDAGEIFLHEYVHLAIHKTFKGQCPLWLNEGLAIVFSGQIDRMLERKVCNCNIYDITYEDDFFYEDCGNIVRMLCYKYGKKFIVSHAKKIESFIDDPILGRDSLNGIL